MAIPFLKVQGAGNDFVLIDVRAQPVDKAIATWSDRAAAVCDRHFGVGADGILLATDSGAAQARMVIINRDGSDGGMCGNGIRCFAKYLIEQTEIEPVDGALAIETGAGTLSVRADGEHAERPEVNMGPAWLEPAHIPVNAEGPSPILNLPLELEGRRLALTCVSMGNPHAVFFTDEPVAGFPLHTIGPLIERHPLFPERTNFEIVNVIAPDALQTRVWERGVGETLACGSGACAVAVAARLNGLSDGPATIKLPGGDLDVRWDGEGPVYLTGPAEFVFEGTLEAIEEE